MDDFEVDFDLDGMEEDQAALLRADFNEYATVALAPLGQAPARHHRLLNTELQALADGKNDRLMVLMPPGSAKSTYCSMLYPPFLLAHESVQTLITASATADLAEKFLGNAKRFHASTRDILNYDLLMARINEWRTSDNKELRAFGATAATAGRRADVAVIDDPFGSWEDAQNEGLRQKVWDWYTGDIVGRLRPGGRVLLVNTHWHQDDLAGRLLVKMAEGGDQWRVINMQAIYDGAEPDPLGRKIGEVLWPEWEPLEQIERKRRIIGEMKFQALFQQNPTPAGGILFPVDKIEKLDAMPDGPIKRARHWDIAGTAEMKGKQPDWTVGLKLAAVGRRWVVEDVKRARLAPSGVEELIVATAKQDGPSVMVGIPQDPGAAGKFMAQHFAFLLAGFNVKTERETGDKVDRATPVAAQVDAGNVGMLRGHWNEAFIAELAAFPNGKHDDQVDGLSGAFKRLFNPAAATKFINIRHGIR